MKIGRNILMPLLFLLGATAASVVLLAAATKTTPACGGSGGCAIAATDAWSKIGPVPAGLMALGWLWLAAVARGRPLMATGVGAFGVAAALAYFGRSVVLSSFCPWCLTLQGCVGAIGISLLAAPRTTGPATVAPVAMRFFASAMGVALVLLMRPSLFPSRLPFDPLEVKAIGFATLDRAETRMGAERSQEVWFVSFVCPICRDKLTRALATRPSNVSLRFAPDPTSPEDLRLCSAALGGRGGGNKFARRIRALLQGERVEFSSASVARERLGEDIALAQRLRIEGVPVAIPADSN